MHQAGHVTMNYIKQSNTLYDRQYKLFFCSPCMLKPLYAAVATVNAANHSIFQGSDRPSQGIEQPDANIPISEPDHPKSEIDFAP